MTEGTVVADQRLACATLTYLAEPGDPALGDLLDVCDPVQVVAAIRADRLPAAVSGWAPPRKAAMVRALGRWRLRLPDLPGDQAIARSCQDGIQLACPGEPRWPAQLDDLGAARPYALWLRGSGDLPPAGSRAVAIVGSRAATGYGAHIAGEIAADLAERGWIIVSGGAYGIDAAAHRGALGAGGITIAVLACGVNHPYPAGHADLFAAIADDGLVISEWPPSSRPARLRFLTRNRVIAALTRGTVIVEAGERSGALNTARHAADLGRPLMAVPGPATSAQSAGCHRIIRDWGGTLVTCAADIENMLTPIGECAEASTPPDSAPAVPLSRDDLDHDSARVLDAFPARSGIGPSTIAATAGVDLDTVIQCLGLLVGCGFIEPCEQGWRLARKAR